MVNGPMLTKSRPFLLRRNKSLMSITTNNVRQPKHHKHHNMIAAFNYNHNYNPTMNYNPFEEFNYWEKVNIKKMSGMFSVVAMTEKTSYRGKIPVYFSFSGCVHPGQNSPHTMFTSGRLKTSSMDAPLVTVCCETSSAQKINMW
jgi:hypothetical protein